MELLRLAALDSEDLAVISAHLQDAILRVGDLAFLPRERRFAMVARRPDWSGGTDERPHRLLSGLCFQQVTRVRTRGIERKNPDQSLHLLGITFDESDAPSGTATLFFSNGGAIQLDLECVEAHMRDLGPLWAEDARSRQAMDAESA